MPLDFNKLWKLLIDKNMNKVDLHLITGISLSTINKLTKNENINTNVLDRICEALGCQIYDIVEYKENKK